MFLYLIALVNPKFAGDCSSGVAINDGVCQKPQNIKYAYNSKLSGYTI